MGVHVRSMSWHMGPAPPGPPAAPGSAAEAQHALSSSPGAGGSDASFDTNMVIILAALLFALLFALGLNSLARFLIRWARRQPMAEEDGGGRSGAGAGKGLKKQALRSIPVEVYGGGDVEVAADVCVICLGEFADGEKVRVLPRCAHGFHVRCVDTWLLSHDSCPTCRGTVLDAAAPRSAPPAAATSAAGPGREAVVTVAIG